MENIFNINEQKDEEIVLQRVDKNFGIVECGMPMDTGDGMIYDPKTGSFGGISA